MSEIKINDVEPLVGYTAAGGELGYDFSFAIFADAELVVLEVSTTGMVKTLILGTDYTVTGAGSESGGSIVFDVTEYPSGAPAGYRYILYRNVPIERVTDFLTGGDFKASTVNRELDKIIMMAQQLELDIKRSLTLKKEDTEDQIDFAEQTPTERASKFLRFNSNGNEVEGADVANLASNVDTVLTSLANNDFLIYNLSSEVFENSSLADTKTLLGVGDDALGKEGSNIASAATVDLGAADSNFAKITGTTAITSFGTTTDKNHLWLYFEDSLTLTHNATSLILPGGANITTQAGDRCEAIRLASGDGDWMVVNYQRAGGVSEFSDDPSPELSGPLDTEGNQVRWSKGADVASAAALPILSDGNYFDVTGTTAITSINTTGKVGTVIKLHFDDALTLTHDATDLILPGGANITTAAGDEAEFVEYASGDFRCTSYTKADGTAVVVEESGTPEWTETSVSLSGSSTTISSIPSGVKEIEVYIRNGTGNTGNEDLNVRIGDSGGIESSGYDCYDHDFTTLRTSTAQFRAGKMGGGGTSCDASFRLSLMDPANDRWVFSGHNKNVFSGTEAYVFFGDKTLSGTLDRIQLLRGAGTFTGGTAYVRYR